MTTAPRPTDKYRAQHVELLRLVSGLADFMNSAELHSAPAKAVALLNTLGGRVKVHLALEDQALYPRLTKSPDSSVRETAEKFKSEMGGIAGAFGQFISKWVAPDAIANDLAGFKSATTSLLAVLKDRIDRENEILYNLVDQMKQ
jgi:iron-sulfur cluster repair protein YtfE (RIC family)